MKKNQLKLTKIAYTLFFVVGIHFSIHAQHSLNLYLGANSNINKPFEYEVINKPDKYVVIKEYKKKQGGCIGAFYEIKLQKILSINIGLSGVLSTGSKIVESNVVGYNTETSTVLKGDNFNFDIDERMLDVIIPASIKIKLINKGLFLKGGFNINYLYKSWDNNNRTIIVNYDPRCYYKAVPYQKPRCNIGTQIGLVYEFKRFGISCDLVSTRLTDNPFTSVEAGISYRFWQKEGKEASQTPPLD